MAKASAPRVMVEYGATGLRQFSGYVREEFLRDLTGWRGQRMYREMRNNDPVIGGMFFAVERLLMGTDFTIEPASQTPADMEASDFINSALGDTEQSWPELVSEILTFLQYGYSVHEICYKRRKGATNDPLSNSKYTDGMIGWRKFASRAQESLLHWNFNEAGDPVAMVQLLPTGGPLLEVPLAKCLHFKTRLLKNNPEGVSLLRNCYIPYFRKKRIEEIEAIGIERDLAGLPIAWVPPRLLSSNASTDDVNQLNAIKKMVRDTVRNDQEGFVYPLAWDKDTKQKLYDFTLLSTGGRRQIDTTAIVDRYDHRILASWLCDFIILGGPGSGGRGSFAQSKNKTDMFSLASASFLDFIVNEFNTKAIPDLLQLNQMQGGCYMRHGDISEGALTDFGQAVSQLASVGLITPDSNTEAAVRDKVGLPPQVGGQQADDLNTGGDADGAADDDPEDVVTTPAGADQGQGDDALSADPAPAAGTRTRRTGRAAAKKRKAAKKK